MKKLLNISVIAALAILPLAANATPVAGDPAHSTATDTTGITASVAPKYALAESESNDGVVATAGYVKGAYNAAIKAINKVSETANSAVQSVTEGATNGTVAVNGADVAVHGLGSAAYTASTDYISSAAGSVKTANIDAGQVTKEKLATDVQTSLDGAIQSVQLNGAALTETNGVVNVTAVQTVGTGTANGTVKVDGTDVAVAGWASKQDTLTSDQLAAVDSGITAAKVSSYDTLVTNSANYATQTGAAATAAAAVNGATIDLSGITATTGQVGGTATVQVMDTWGSNTVAAQGVAVDLTNTQVVTGLNGNTSGVTGKISVANVAYTAN